MSLFFLLNRITESEFTDFVVKQQVLCTGDAGAGKTTLSERLASLWAGGKLSTPFWDSLKTIIFVTATDEEDNLTQTMRNAIPGKKAYKDLMMDLYTDEPESVLVIIEALDQFQNPAVIKAVIQMLKDKATNVLLTIRKGSPLTTSDFLSLFNHQFEVAGFRPEEQDTYTRKFLKQMQLYNGVNGSDRIKESLDNDNKIDIDQFLKAIKNKHKISSNPLNLSLACLLYSEGELDISDLDELTEVSLYRMREDRMVEREGSGKSRKKELKKLHSLALYLLMMNKTTCSDEELACFKIEPQSPVLVLLDRQTYWTARHGQLESWSWPHSRLFEFDAAMGLAGMKDFKDTHWLYWIASKPELNHVAKLVAAVLSHDTNYEDLIVLTSATIILQSKAKCLASSESLQSERHPCAWTTCAMTLVDSMNPESCFSHGEVVLKHGAIELPDLSLLCECRGSLFNGNVSLFKHVQECWRLGCLHVNNAEYIGHSQAVLLPASDS